MSLTPEQLQRLRPDLKEKYLLASQNLADSYFNNLVVVNLIEEIYLASNTGTEMMQ